MAPDYLHRASKGPFGLSHNQMRAIAVFFGVAFVLLGISQIGRAGKQGSGQIALISFGSEEEVVLKNAEGVEVRVLTLGAVVQSLSVPDKHGNLGDVVLGFDELKPYKDGTSPYFGAVVGRVANRIAGAKFVLGERQYNLSANDPPNSLHGGEWGWSRKAWSIVKREAFDDGGCSVKLEYTSKDMEEGYPGKVTAWVTYKLLAGSTLQIEFEAEADAETPINMAQHTYFNLEGVEQSKTILDHTIEINSSFITPVDATRIPTGAFEAVKDTPFDFSKPQRIGEKVADVPGPPPSGYDVNYVLWGRDGETAFRETQHCKALAEPAVAARVHAPESGRTLEVLTNSPGLQSYSGNMLDGSLRGKGGVAYPQYGGFALETQMFPNFVNQPSFPQCILQPGQRYHVIDVWRFKAE